MRAREFLPERTEPFQGLDLEMEFDEDEIWVTARDPSGRELGHVLFVDTGDELVPQDLEVEERFRGQGIARTMYDWVKSKGYRIRRSNSQTRAGAEFWNKNRPGENVWEQGVAEGLTTEKQILTRIRQIMYDRKLSGTESNAGELLRLKQQLKGLRSQQGVAEGTLNEYRDQLWAWIQSKFPSTQWPEYVQRDFLYAKAKGLQSQKDLEDFLDEIQRDFGRVRWRLEKLPITLDVFTAKTQGMIRQREGGSSNPFQVPRDAERHALQQRMIQQTGVSPEPIIVAKLSNGYDLIEGWHRTIQHLKAYPEGYTAPAWVGYGATYTSELKPGLAEGIDPDTFEDLDPRIIARAAKRIVPTARARRTPEGYVYLTTEDGLDLYIGATVADGVISVNIGSGGGLATSGANKGAVTEIIRGVYDAAVRKYGRPDTPGELTIDHDAGHGVWQHIADKLGLRYDAVQVKESGIRPDDVSENFADGKKKGKSRPGRVKRAGASCSGSVSDLRARAKKYGGERGKMYHWCANMKGGKKK